MQKTMSLLTGSPTDATSFYRAIGPFSRLRETFEFNVMFNRELSWATLSWSNILFMHRPDNVNHVQVAKIARKMGRKVWIDFDDDMTCVPTDNPCFKDALAAKPWAIECLKIADVVTVTTEAMKENFSKWNKNIHVIPNGVDSRIFKGPEKTEPNKLILWRGTPTHDRDLWTYASAITRALEKHPDWRIIFLGYNPWFITNHLKDSQYTLIEGQELLSYFELIQKMKPDIMIVPLHDSPFNRAKSNIAWLEGSMAGAAVVRPAWENWAPEIPEGSYATNDDLAMNNFYNEFDLLMSHSYDQLGDINKRSVEVIKQKYMLDDLNVKRKELIEAL